MNRLQHHLRSCSDNCHRECYALKLDIEGYFMHIDRKILFDLIMRRIDALRAKGRLPEEFDYDTVTFLLGKVVFLDPTRGCRIKGSPDDWKGLPGSKSLFKAAPGCGLPIENLTSQLFSNIYLNELDQFVKRGLGFRHYGRYVDDFYILSESRTALESAVPKVDEFLQSNLHLRLNSRKTALLDAYRGVPFLGSVVAPSGKFLSARTLRRVRGKYLDALCYQSDPYAVAAVENSCRGHLAHFSVKFTCGEKMPCNVLWAG